MNLEYFASWGIGVQKGCIFETNDCVSDSALGSALFCNRFIIKTFVLVDPKSFGTKAITPRSTKLLQIWR